MGGKFTGSPREEGYLELFQDNDCIFIVVDVDDLWSIFIRTNSEISPPANLAPDMTTHRVTCCERTNLLIN